MLSKVAKIVGFVGGVAALIWAMRDRFISVAVSREPEPPAFRGWPAEGPGLESLNGVGPTYAQRLREAGFTKPGDLVAADAEEIARIAGVSASRARSWLDQIQS
jgi:predicted flap endonuclease-1-like 5' DNA nuclease